MKINNKILSIPPYISTKWENIVYFKFVEEKSSLMFVMSNGDKVFVPNPTKEICDTVFSSHQVFLESGKSKTNHLPMMGNIALGITPDQWKDGFTGIMQHDPKQKDSPLLPKDILDKISNFAKTIDLNNNMFNLPEGEPSCNCPYCQITNAIHGKPEESVLDEEVKLEDITFKEWNVECIDKYHYSVTQST